MKRIIKFVVKYIIYILLHIFYLLPVNKKKIYFRSMLGTQYSCNPKYLYLYILEKFGNDYKYIWELKSKKQRTLIPNGKVCLRHSLMAAINMMTAGYIIDNVEIGWYIPIRKKQTVVATWHGGGAYKRVGLDNLTVQSRVGQFQTKMVSRKITYYLSSSEVFSKNQSVSKDVPIEKFVPTGMPRNSILQLPNENIVSKVKKELNIKDFHTVLYAPTYRGYGEFKGSGSKLAFSFPDFKLLISNLEKRLGGKWLLLYRSHNFDSSIKVALPADAINATSYPDMQELLCACDVLITDFSSSMWDFGLTKKPCFLFAPDLQNYLTERGFYTDPYSWPFNMTETDEELTKKILNFNEDEYLKSLEEYYNFMGSFESPDSCKKIIEILNL